VDKIAKIKQSENSLKEYVFINSALKIQSYRLLFQRFCHWVSLSEFLPRMFFFFFTLLFFNTMVFYHRKMGLIQSYKMVLIFKFFI